MNNLGRNTDHVGSEADKGEIYLQDYTGKDRIRSVYVAFAKYMFPKFLKKKKEESKQHILNTKISGKAKKKKNVGHPSPQMIIFHPA